jgi:flagellar basal-body rod protein FlgF
MLKGIYTPLSGAIAQERVLEVIANNLANMNTNAFKGENVTFTLLEPEPEKNYKNPLPPANYKVAFEDFMPLRGNEIHYVGVAGINRDQSQGPVVKTGNPTDLMIEGKGYLSINTPEGIRYTRDGALQLSSDGVLTTAAGHPVMGEKGNVVLRSGQFEVNGRGEIYQNGELVDKLQLFQFQKDEALERVGGNYFYFGGEQSARTKSESPSIRQGQLEGSNVNAIKNLTAMILAHRSYESYQKAVSNYDTMMEKSSNSIGDVRA